MRTKNQEAKNARAGEDFGQIIAETVKLWRKGRLDYDQTAYVVQQARKALKLKAPTKRRPVVQRLERPEIERLIEASYRVSDMRPEYGLMVKTLFYTGTRVDELVNIEAEHLFLEGDEPQVYIAKAKKGSVRYVPILASLAQELRTHLRGRTRGHLFESNRMRPYSTRMVQKLVKEAATKAGITKRVYPHLVRHSVAQILYDNGMALEQLQKFLGHADPKTTQIYAETSLKHVIPAYKKALE